MKQKDILTIVVIAILSGIISLSVSNWLIAPKKSFNKKASVAPTISSDFVKPDPKYFNKDAIDPTKLITIGDNPNKSPF